MLNQLINLFWTIVSFAVFGVYWGRYFAEQKSPWMLILFIVISLSMWVIPGKWLSRLAISKNKRDYERVGIKFLLFFVQNGTLVNRIKSKYSNKSGLIHTRKQAQNYLKTVAMQERYHYCCFVLFLLTTLCAFSTGNAGMALLIMLFNTLYNIYPILLQQYNRLRIDTLLRR